MVEVSVTLISCKPCMCMDRHTHLAQPLATLCLWQSLFGASLSSEDAQEFGFFWELATGKVSLSFIS